MRSMLIAVLRLKSEVEGKKKAGAVRRPSLSLQQAGEGPNPSPGSPKVSTLQDAECVSRNRDRRRPVQHRGLHNRPRYRAVMLQHHPGR